MHRKELAGGDLVILLHTGHTKEGIMSHLYSKRTRTHVQSIDMHAASQAQVGCRSVIVMMHCFSRLTLFSSLLEFSDLQHPSLDTTCNRDLLGIITFKTLHHSLWQRTLLTRFHANNRACAPSSLHWQRRAIPLTTTHLQLTESTETGADDSCPASV